MAAQTRPIRFGSFAEMAGHLDRWAARTLTAPEAWETALVGSHEWLEFAPRNQALLLSYEIDGPAAAQRIGEFDLAEELQLALQQLREEYRTCFLLFHQQELSLHEVARMMNCPDGTIKTWLHRARRELAELLKGRGVVTEGGHELFRI